MSDRTADQSRYANEQMVVPSQNEEDRLVPLPFPFRHLHPTRLPWISIARASQRPALVFDLRPLWTPDRAVRL